MTAPIMKNKATIFNVKNGAKNRAVPKTTPPITNFKIHVNLYLIVYK
jgi:hypothetical protein